MLLSSQVSGFYPRGKRIYADDMRHDRVLFHHLKDDGLQVLEDARQDLYMEFRGDNEINKILPLLQLEKDIDESIDKERIELAIQICKIAPYLEIGILPK